MMSFDIGNWVTGSYNYRYKPVKIPSIDRRVADHRGLLLNDL